MGPAPTTINSTNLLVTGHPAHPGKSIEFSNYAPSTCPILDAGDRCIRGALPPHQSMTSGCDHPRLSLAKAGRLPGGGGIAWAGAHSCAISSLCDPSKSAPALGLGFSTWNHRACVPVPMRPRSQTGHSHFRAQLFCKVELMLLQEIMLLGSLMPQAAGVGSQPGLGQSQYLLLLTTSW